jgi:hypothetical protein
MGTVVYAGGHRVGVTRVLVLGRGPVEWLRYRPDLRALPSDCYSWGKHCAGAESLAISILADALDDEWALWGYREYAAEVLANLPEDGWELTADGVRDWAFTARCWSGFPRRRPPAEGGG